VKEALSPKAFFEQLNHRPRNPASPAEPVYFVVEVCLHLFVKELSQHYGHDGGLDHIGNDANVD
jgi:hypothetical protein